MYRVILAVGLLVVCLLVAGSGPMAEARPSSPDFASAPPTKTIDCTQIKRLGFDRQTNLHAAEVLRQCGYGGGSTTTQSAIRPASTSKGRVFDPANYGGLDVDMITGFQPIPFATQFRGFTWGNGKTIVSAYLDNEGVKISHFSGMSYSTDGGSTFTRLNPSPFWSGHGADYGDGTVVYDAQLGKWFASALSVGCGGQGIGLWTSPDGVSWQAGPCAHATGSGGDDRISMWADNGSSSPYYGRVYVSWNDFNAGENIYVTYSDDGAQWSAPVRVQQPGFIRNVNITGSPVDGTVYIAGTDEGGGGLSTRMGIVYRSTSGGATWAVGHTIYGPFAAPGVTACGWFVLMPPMWSDMGWGQLGVDANGVLDYAYTAHGQGTDPGDIYYTRSTDSGATWSVPLRLNTDSTSREQWQPSLSVTANGAVMVGWYDRRDTTDYSYQYWGRASTDGGLTWLPDQPVSDAISPEPDEQGCATNYNYASASGIASYLTWTDYRNLVSGTPQPDVYFDKVQLGQATSTPTRTPRSCTPIIYSYSTATATIVPGVTDTGNHCDDCSTAITLPFAFTLYEQTVTSAFLDSNGFVTLAPPGIKFNECLPEAGLGSAIFPYHDDLVTTSNYQGCTAYPTGCGIFTSISGSAPNRIFNIEWRAVTFGSQNDPVNVELRLHETPMWGMDFVYGQVSQNGSSATVGVQEDAGSFTQFSCNTPSLQSGLRISWGIKIDCEPTMTPSRTRTTTATPTPCVPNYSYATATGTIVPGTTDTGNHTDDGTTTVTLPFAFRLYDRTFSTANVGSNGTVQFNSNLPGIASGCPPSGFSYSVIPNGDDLRTDGTDCTGGCGIFTSVSGTAPNRIFNIEWRTSSFTGVGHANFEVRLYENAPGQQFDFVYGRLDQTGGLVGVVKDSTEYVCYPGGLVSQGLKITWTAPPCGTDTPTPTPTGGTPTIAATLTYTPAPTLTPCGGFSTWSSAAAIPSPRARALGVNYGDAVYLFGGRPDATTYSNTVFRYDLLADSWTQLTGTLPDQFTSNMGGGLLTFPEGQRIFIVGGSGPDSAMTGRALAFDPTTGAFTPKAAWPATPVRIPGGWAVANNKLYVFGGFEVNVAMHDEIWVYDPMLDSWTQLSTRLSIARAYIATETMPNGRIYLAGGSQYIAGFLSDQTVFEIFDPANNTIMTGMPMRFARSNNQGYNLNGTFTVVSGGALTFDDVVQAYIEYFDEWTTGPHIPYPARNYAKGYGLNGAILTIGGTDGTNFFSYNQKLIPGGSCGSVTPTATATTCPTNFTDVYPSDYFYEAVRYLNCAGVVSGYADGTFRPYNNTTRGQMCKIIVLARGWPLLCPQTPTFNDVPQTHPFYCYVETAYAHGIVSGYSCGTGCLEFRPQNNVTRGQLCKIVVLAMEWAVHCPPTGHFTDVPPVDPFYCYIETAYEHGIISGYDDGTFRPGNSATRGQICVIVYRAVTGP